jgi:hypothetical protein
MRPTCDAATGARRRSPRCGIVDAATGATALSRESQPLARCKKASVERVMCLVIRVLVCISMTCRLCLLFRLPKPFIAVKSDFVCVLRCWSLRHPVTFAKSERLECVALIFLNLVHGQCGFPKAGAYSEHRMSSTICDGCLDQQLTSRLGSGATLSLAWQPQAPSPLRPFAHGAQQQESWAAVDFATCVWRSSLSLTLSLWLGSPKRL